MTEKKTTASKPADDFIRIQDLWGFSCPGGTGLPSPVRNPGDSRLVPAGHPEHLHPYRCHFGER